jgi:tetratricopeptide (TPR) repeat protein
MRLYDKAVDAYRQAAELGELSEPITLGLADAHIKLDNFELAINVLNTQIQQVPSAFAYERLGYACYKTKRYEDAMANFRAALLYDPNHAPALNGLGVSLMTIYIQTDRKTPRQRDEALGLWHKSIQLRPSQAKIVKLIEQFQLW